MTVYQSSMAKRQGIGSSGTGFAFILAEIKELQPDKNICLAQNIQTGDQQQVGLNKRGETAWPQVGDIWVLDRSMGHWMLQCKVTEEAAPAFTGFFNTMDADVLRLVTVLKGLGLIRDATTAGPTPPSKVFTGSQNTMRPEFISLLALLDTLGVIDDQTTAQTLPVGQWQLVTSGMFSSPWQNYGGSYQVARYMIETSGFVVIEGLVKTSSAVSGFPTIFTLPAGFRPVANHVFPSEGQNTPSARQLEVLPSGVVRLANFASATVDFTTVSCRFSTT